VAEKPRDAVVKFDTYQNTHLYFAKRQQKKTIKAKNKKKQNNKKSTVTEQRT